MPVIECERSNSEQVEQLTEAGGNVILDVRNDETFVHFIVDE